MHSQRARRGSKMFSPPAQSSITAKWSGHRGNIVMPPPCIHTAGHNCRHHTAGHHAALQWCKLQWCKPHCKSVAQHSGCRLQEGRCSSSRLPPRTDKRQPCFILETDNS